MDTGIGNGILQIAMGLMAIALIALLISQASGTNTVLTSIAGNFSNLLNTVMLRGGNNNQSGN